jgi:peptidoglycan/LPS O-acetylase OafA/YrhL
LLGLPFGILNRATPAGAALEFTFSEWIFLGFMCFSLGLSGRWAQVLSQGPLRLAGELSYCLYLINLIVFDQWDGIIRRFDPAQLLHPSLGYYLVRVTCCVIVSFVIAALSWHFIEQPILTLKRFVPASGSREISARQGRQSEAAA